MTAGRWSVTEDNEIVYSSDFHDRSGHPWPEVTIEEVYVDHADLPYNLVVGAKADLSSLLAAGEPQKETDR